MAGKYFCDFVAFPHCLKNPPVQFENPALQTHVRVQHIFLAGELVPGQLNRKISGWVMVGPMAVDDAKVLNIMKIRIWH